MTRVFVDTQYWVAITDPRDPWKAAALRAIERVAEPELVTTEEVLIEFLGFVSGGGRSLRELASDVAAALMEDRRTTVIPQSHGSFLDGLALYQARPDKGYSLVDCISMITMRARGIRDVLTADHHFRQEGFRALLLGDV